MASHICVGYLLCRVADTIEDAAHVSATDQSELLLTYQSAIDPTETTSSTDFRSAIESKLPTKSERDDDWSVVAAAPTILATFESFPSDVRQAILPPVLEMIGGMDTFVNRYSASGGLRIQDRPELDEYCHYAAGTVGRLVTNLVTRGRIAQSRMHTLSETAESFGLLLQLVNISKDVYTDYAVENNVYLPAKWLAEENIDQDAVLERANRPGAARVIERTIGHARSFLDDAERYLEAMPLRHGNTIHAWSVPFLLAVGTLRELSERPEDALREQGVKITKAEVLTIMSAAHDGGRGAIPRLRGAIAEQPFHLTQ